MQCFVTGMISLLIYCIAIGISGAIKLIAIFTTFTIAGLLIMTLEMYDELIEKISLLEAEIDKSLIDEDDENV